MDVASLNPQEALKRFQQIVLQDDQLLAQLQQTADLEGFARLAVQLGQLRGCAFTAEDVRAAVQEARRLWWQRWI